MVATRRSSAASITRASSRAPIKVPANKIKIISNRNTASKKVKGSKPLQPIKPKKPESVQNEIKKTNKRTRSQARFDTESTQGSDTKVEEQLIHQVFMNVFNHHKYEVVEDYSSFFIKYEIQPRNSVQATFGSPITQPVLNKYQHWQIY